MKFLKIIICLAALNFANGLKAENTFPVFAEQPIKISIPTNTQFYQHDKKAEIGSNAVYSINGQIFANAADGHIQTTAEGFNGMTDKSTPWKTLTELLAVYQQGGDEKKLRALYILRPHRNFLIKFLASRK